MSENRQLTLGSLFDGSGGFPLGGVLAGIGWSDQDDDMTFSMVDENAKDLNGEGEDVRVKGRSVGDALAERRFLGFIDTHGSFSPSSDDPLP